MSDIPAGCLRVTRFENILELHVLNSKVIKYLIDH